MDKILDQYGEAFTRLGENPPDEQQFCMVVIRYHDKELNLAKQYCGNKLPCPEHKNQSLIKE